MRKFFTLLLLSVSCVSAASTTLVQDTIYTQFANVKFSGYLRLTAQPFTDVDNTAYGGWEMTQAVSNGVLSIRLQATNATIKVDYTPSSGNGTTWSEYWQVPASNTTLRLKDVRVSSSVTPTIPASITATSPLLFNRSTGVISFDTTANLAPSGYYNFAGGSLRFPEVLFASLPSAASAAGKTYIVPDAANKAGCGVGGGDGTTPAQCYSNGVSWIAMGGGVQSLNGLTGLTQTFTNDTNVTITSSGTVHALGWTGTLAKTRQHPNTLYSDGTYSDPPAFTFSRSGGRLTGFGGAAALNVGTTAGTVAAGDDSRLSNARTPTAHASTHSSAGSDPVTVAESQVTGLVTDLAAKLGLHAKADTAGAADTAAALASLPTKCTAGNYPLGVDTAGNAVNCTLVLTLPSVTNLLVGNGSGGAADSGKVVPAGAIVGTTDTQVLSNKTMSNGTSVGGVVFDGSGTSLPGTCTVGHLYFLTAGTIGLYQCTATNIWTLPGETAWSKTALNSIGSTVTIDVTSGNPTLFTGTLTASTIVSIIGPAGKIVPYALQWSTGTGGFVVTHDASFTGALPLTRQAGITCTVVGFYDGSKGWDSDVACPGATPEVVISANKAYPITTTAADGDPLATVSAPKTFTNTAYAADGTGNNFSIGGVQRNLASGNSPALATKASGGSWVNGSPACPDINGNLDTAACSSGGLSFKTQHIVDNFARGANTSPYGDLNWTTTGTGMSVSADPFSIAGHNATLIKLITGSTSGNDATIYLGQNNNGSMPIYDISAETNWQFDAVFSPDDVTHCATGVTVNNVNDGHILNTTASANGDWGIGAMCDSAIGTNVYFFITSSNTLTTYDTGITCETSPRHRYRLETISTGIGTATMNLYRDGTNVFSVAAGSGQTFNKAFPGTGRMYGPAYSVLTHSNASCTGHFGAFEWLATGLAR